MRSEAGAALNARIDFRRDDGGRKLGGIQIYFGRTSPLEFRGYPNHRVKLTADKEYASVSPALFDTMNSSDLPRKEDALRLHLEQCGKRAASTFMDGEAASHNGMMRRYGLFHRHGDPMLAVDSEVRVGFRQEGPRTGTHLRNDHEAELRTATNLGSRDSVPRKLDTIGILPGGEVALVEVKDAEGDTVRAVHQAAAHIFTFGRMLAQPASDLVEMLNGMVVQKQRAGLIPNGALPSASKPNRLIPIVAAPNADPSWPESWLRTTAGPRAHSAELLNGLRFWRLSETGEVLDEHIV